MDESSHVPAAGKAHKFPYFLIAGLIIPDAQWKEIAAEFERIKALPGYRVEGEIKWRYFGPDNNDARNPLLHLPIAKRNALRLALLSLITKRRSCRIVATKSDTARAWELPYVKNKADLYHFTYKQTLERFEYFLQDISRINGAEQRGMVICDHRGRDEDRILRDYHAEVTERLSTFTSDFKHLVERVMLTDSQHSVGVQLADLCAGALCRSYTKDEPYWLEMLRSNIRAHPIKGIDGYGVVHWPK
ncbi:DUF3800 domain-containing protein [Brevundimonas sp. 2R-24]|uniref:DUF3800 domain-containing protein n=1 Tax=Peiella sedimenti TaxID=3061083 RepID=A0ABT8SMP8_9CAUL|nr:DUF3800 domain-containing protein [Caulobacteraceae bacterium XZ-24]